MLLLVVEDDAAVARFLTRGLREEGFQVDLCENGADAAEQGLAQPYDLLLLDWALPDMDGVSVLRRWRAGGVEAPVIMLTARTGVSSTVLALDAGADDYLEKPFSFEELLARIRARLRRIPQSTDAGQVQVGTATVDLRRRVLLRGQEELELSRREFVLLDVLLKHRGEVLSRSRLLDLAWGMSHDPNTNVVDVYVRYLRNKLDGEERPGVAGSIIETVRGRGYRLRPQEEWS